MKSDKEHRECMIAQELKAILEGTQEFVLEHYDEEEFDPEAVQALKKAAQALAYRKKYYNALSDKVVYFPSVARLILKADLMEEAEKHYYDSADEWPIEYTKALKSVVRGGASASSSGFEMDQDDEDEEYMEKLAIDVEL